MILNNSFEDPYNKFAPEGPLPIISKSLAKAKLTKKFSQITDLDTPENYDKLNNLLNQQENSKIIK